MTWFLTYLFLSGSLVTLAYSYFRFGIRAITPGSFAHHPENGHMRSMDVPDGAFILALLMGNKTQVFLATCYYFYNGLLTRFMAEREWNAYSLAYQPLRVTQPRGSQTSTYRLQLPYRLSIPLIAVIALLHWTLSNTYYLSIFEGGQSSLPLCYILVCLLVSQGILGATARGCAAWRTTWDLTPTRPLHSAIRSRPFSS